MLNEHKVNQVNPSQYFLNRGGLHVGYFMKLTALAKRYTA